MKKKLAALTLAMTAGLIAVSGPAALGEPASEKSSLDSPALSSTNDNPTVVDGVTVPTEVREGFRVLPYLQRAASDEMTINWFSETGGTSQVTVFGPGLPENGLTLDVEGVHNPVNTYQAGELALGDLNRNNAKGVVPQGTWIRGEKPYKHSAHVTGLVPNSDYTYRVNEDGYVHEASFSTFPEAGSDLTEPIHIIAFSDTETDPVGRVTYLEWVETTTLAEGSEPRPDASSLWAEKYGVSTRDGKTSVNYPVTEDDAQRVNNALIEELDPDMILLPGDLTERASWQTHWDEWFRYFAGDQGQVLDSIPIFTSPGNHEVYGYCASPDDCTPVVRARAAYNQAIDTHGSTNEHALDAYHRTDYGPVTFISIDSTNGTDQNIGDPEPMTGNDANITDEQLRTDTQNSFTIAQYEAAFPVAVEQGCLPGVEPTDPIDQPNFMPGSEQHIWLEEQLEDARSNGQTIIVQYHHVAYSNGTHGTTMNHAQGSDAQPGTPMRHLEPLFEEYDVAAVFSGHDEMFQSSYVDQAGDGTGVYHWDVGVASDGLRGDKMIRNEDGEYVPLLFNTHSTWMAQADEPEMWETNENGVRHLVSGGKHYGHLDIQIQPYTGTVLTSGAMPEAEMVMTPVSLFPILDDNYDLVDIERRELLTGQQTVYLDANGSPLAGEPTEVEEPTPADPIPSGNAFALSNSWDSTTHDVAFAYGRIGDEVLVGDWDGNRTDTLAVRRGTTFYVNNELRGGNADAQFNYGRAGDEVRVGDWDGNGTDTFAVRRGTTFYVNNELRGGNADAQFNYGRGGDEVLVGDWDGADGDTFAVRRGTTFFINNDLRGGQCRRAVRLRTQW